MATQHSGNGWFKRHRRLLLIGGPILFVLVAGYVYLTGGRYISTDDAYIQSARTEISANIAGRVVELRVHDNQEVSAGDVLFKLDDRDLVIAVEEAKAKLAVARLQVSALKATYQQRQAGLQEAKDTLAYQQQEFERQKTLAAQGISSQAQLELARHAVASASQQVNAVIQERENIRASLGDNPDLDVDEHPSVRLAQAALDRAELNLSYTVIKAPADGIVTKVEQLQAGTYIKAATPVFSLVSKKDIWVLAAAASKRVFPSVPASARNVSRDQLVAALRKMLDAAGGGGVRRADGIGPISARSQHSPVIEGRQVHI